MVFAREIHTLDDHDAALEDRDRVALMRENIRAGDTYIARKVVSKDVLVGIREYLETVGRSSMPSYHPIAEGSPNSHRMNRWDPRSYVAGCFHQFVFFPWNDDPFDLFNVFRPVYHMKNLLSGLPNESFLGVEPENGCIARMAFQFYPRGIGGLNTHSDPVDYHQLTVPTMLLSRKGEDYERGGAFVEKANGERIHIDDLCDWGDVAYFNAQIRHGVERIDPEAKPDWLSFRGRWMLLFAVNKLLGNTRIGDSVDLNAPETESR